MKSDQSGDVGIEDFKPHQGLDPIQFWVGYRAGTYGYHAPSGGVAGEDRWHPYFIGVDLGISDYDLGLEQDTLYDPYRRALAIVLERAAEYQVKPQDVGGKRDSYPLPLPPTIAARLKMYSSEAEGQLEVAKAFRRKAGGSR